MGPTSSPTLQTRRTTNCLAPLAKVINSYLGIVEGLTPQCMPPPPHRKTANLDVLPHEEHVPAASSCASTIVKVLLVLGALLRLLLRRVVFLLRVLDQRAVLRRDDDAVDDRDRASALPQNADQRGRESRASRLAKTLAPGRPTQAAPRGMCAGIHISHDPLLFLGTTPSTTAGGSYSSVCPSPYTIKQKKKRMVCACTRHQGPMRCAASCALAPLVKSVPSSITPDVRLPGPVHAAQIGLGEVPTLLDELNLAEGKMFGGGPNRSGNRAGRPVVVAPLLASPWIKG